MRALLLLLVLSDAPAWAGPDLTIAVGTKASPVERRAARELEKYLRLLYRFTPGMASDNSPLREPTILIGSPANNNLTAALARDLPWRTLSDDGYFLTTVKSNPDVLIAGGRTGRATLYAVYDLVQRWGVRFSLSEDILPEKPESLRLVGFDEKIEPAYPIRALRPVNNLPEGSAAWDLTDFERFIDQMAKLRYNTYVFVVMESGPWLDYEFRGLPRPAGDIFYGWRYPITIGKELFAGRREFYSPLLGRARNGDERKRLGIGLVHSILTYAKQLDLMTGLVFPLLEPPTAFKRKFNEWATLPLPNPKNFPGAHFTETPVEEFGTNPKYAAWMNVKDPVVKDLTRTRVKTLIDTYPEADYYFFWVSEHRAGVVDYREIYRELDARHHFDFNLEEALQDLGDFAYGKDRYQNQIKGDLSFLYMFDQVFRQDRLLERTARPEARIAVSGVMPRLGPLVVKLLSDEWLYAAWPEYGTHAVANRVHVLDPVLRANVPTTVEIGIQDDNTMWFPQISVESLQRIIEHTAPLRLKGYVATLWQVRQADINAAYLAEASWRPFVTSEAFYRDYLTKLVGAPAASDFERVLRTLERADREAKDYLYGFAFAFEGALANKLNGVNRAAIARLRPQFSKAAEDLRRARAKTAGPARAPIDFWLKRTQVAIGWLDLGVAAADLGRLLGEIRRSGIPLTTEQKKKALAATDSMQREARVLIELVASDARSPGDLGQVASMNRYIYDWLAELRADLAVRPVEER